MSANFKETAYQGRAIDTKFRDLISKLRRKIERNELVDIVPIDSAPFIKIASLSELQNGSISDPSSYAISPIAIEVRCLMSNVMMELVDNISSKYLVTIFETWRDQVALLLGGYKGDVHELYRDEILLGVLDSLERIVGRGLTKVYATHHYLNSSIYSEGHWD